MTDPRIDPDPISNTSSGLDAMEVLETWAGMFGSIVANAKDPAVRAKLIRMMAELQHEMLMDLEAAELLTSKEAAINNLVENMTGYVDSLLPLYNVVRKRNAARNN